MSVDSADGAFRALDEARELFYAANLVLRATSQPIDAAPLLKRSLLLVLAALAAKSGVTSFDRDRVVFHALELMKRESPVDRSLSDDLELLDALESRFADLSATASPDEASKLDELVEAMPEFLATAENRLLLRDARRRLAGTRRARVRFAVGILAAMGAGVLFARWIYG